MNLACVTFAVIRLAMPFADGMVLQQGRPVPVWGTAETGSKVEVRFAGQVKSTVTAADGRWKIALDPMSASRVGRKMEVRLNQSDGQTTSISDVLVGEVWICAGQSNMELPLWGEANVSPHAEQSMDMGYVESMTLNDPLVRTCQTPKIWAREPQDFPERLAWRRFSPGAQQDFSAVGCHFAQLLRQALDVPVGVVSVAWGGAKIEGFLPASGFRAAEGFEKLADRPVLAQDDPKQQFPKEPNDQARSIWNGRIYALVPMAFRGVLWYQGESNIGEGLRYEHLLTGLRTGWMMEFSRTELPVYVVQIAPFHYSWMEKGGILDFCDIWEGMANFVRKVPDAALVTTVDLGEQKNIHPAGKRTVALRLAANALNRIYGRKDIACASPELDSVEADCKGAVRLEFRNVGRWLMHGEYAVPFELAEEDGRFCEAKVSWPSAGVIKLSVPGMAKPSKVRYMWNWTKRATLANEYGFPLAPFRADVPKVPTENRRGQALPDVRQKEKR